VVGSLAVSSSVPIRVEAIVPTRTLTPSGPITIAVSINADNIPITRSTVTASIYSLTKRVASLVLHDDGAHGDGASDDGVYGNFFTSDNSGEYMVKLDAKGSWQGVEYERNANWLVSVPENNSMGGRIVYLPLILRR
jgi:hypothetical protein